MESKNFWQLFFGKEPLSKMDFIKAWLGWWVILIVVIFILTMCTTSNLKFVAYAFAFGFCQIVARYVVTLGWNKYWGALGVLPITNIPFFLFLIFYHK